MIPFSLLLLFSCSAGCGLDGTSWAIMFKLPAVDLAPGVRSRRRSTSRSEGRSIRGWKSRPRTTWW